MRHRSSLRHAALAAAVLATLSCGTPKKEAQPAPSATSRDTRKPDTRWVDNTFIVDEKLKNVHTNKESTQPVTVTIVDVAGGIVDVVDVSPDAEGDDQHCNDCSQPHWKSQVSSVRFNGRTYAINTQGDEDGHTLKSFDLMDTLDFPSFATTMADQAWCIAGCNDPEPAALAECPGGPWPSGRVYVVLETVNDVLTPRCEVSVPDGTPLLAVSLPRSPGHGQRQPHWLAASRDGCKVGIGEEDASHNLTSLAFVNVTPGRLASCPAGP